MQDVLVPKVGLEPTRDFTSADFESAASANSATSAHLTMLLLIWLV